MGKYYLQVTWDEVVDLDGDAYVRYDEVVGRSVWVSSNLLIPEGRVTVAPDEPTGFGAVVRDVELRLWLRHQDGTWRPGFGDGLTWDELIEDYGPVVVESPGIEP